MTAELDADLSSVESRSKHGRTPGCDLEECDAKLITLKYTQ